MASEHLRAAYDFLRSRGVTDMSLEPGGKHNRLRFTYQGLERRYIVAHRPSKDSHAKANMLADLRRIVGDAVPEPKIIRTMEDLMTDLHKDAERILPAQPEEPPAVIELAKPASKVVWQGTMSCYKNLATGPGGGVVYIILPRHIKDVFPDRVTTIRLDDENWKIVGAKDGSSMFADYGNNRVKISYVDHEVKPFGSTAVEAVEVDGELLIYSPLDKRSSVTTKYHPSAKWDVQAPVETSRVVTPPPPQPAPPVVIPARHPVETTPIPEPVKAPVIPTVPLENFMREVLGQVREIEAKSPYRLVRLESGRLLWRAPVIE